MRYAEVGNRVEVGDEEEAENKGQTSLRNAGPPDSARARSLYTLRGPSDTFSEPGPRARG
jgi:hypothetical protein